MDSELQQNIRSGRLWRLNNLYRITDRNGRRVAFTMNSAQQALYHAMHRQNVILKARQRGFGGADLATIPNIIRLDALFLPQNQSIYPLDRYEPDDFEVISGGMLGGGKPTAYTFIDNTILLWPNPTAVYTMRLHAFYKLPDAADGDTDAWTDDAEELVRSHAKMLLYMDVLEDDQNAQRMATKIPVLLDGLRSETSARMATGRIRGTEF